MTDGPRPPGGTRLERVEVVDEERIVARGSARTTWFAREGEAWTKLSALPGAELESRDPGPGTVWERAVTVALAEGTQLMRVETRPLPEPARDPLAYLEREARVAPRATRRTYYRVVRGGRLQPLREGR